MLSIWFPNASCIQKLTIWIFAYCSMCFLFADHLRFLLWLGEASPLTSLAEGVLQQFGRVSAVGASFLCPWYHIHRNAPSRSDPEIASYVHAMHTFPSSSPSEPPHEPLKSSTLRNVPHWILWDKTFPLLEFLPVCSPLIVKNFNLFCLRHWAMLFLSANRCI